MTGNLAAQKRSGLIVCMLVVMVAAGCRKKPSEHDMPSQDGPAEHSVSVALHEPIVQAVPLTEKCLARVGDQAVNAKMLDAYLALRPMPEHVLDVNDIVRARLEELVLEELLYREALRLKLDQEPVTRFRIRQILAQSLLEREVERPAYETGISEEEIAAYYQQHEGVLCRPEQRRAAVIFLAAEPDDSRDSQRKKAEAVLARALKTRTEATGFTRLIKEVSDKPDNHPLGDTGFFDRSGGRLGLHPALVNAVFELTAIGQIGRHIVETPEGFYIIRLINMRSPVTKELDDVRHEIERKLRESKRKELRDAYLESLRSGVNIQINDDVLMNLIRNISREKHGPLPGLPD